MVASWFTPTVLFCFLNLIIICIFIASYSKSHQHQLGQHDSPQLNRSSSLLARVKSINFSFRNYDHDHYPQTLLTDPQNDNHVTGVVTPEDAHVPATTEKKLSVSQPVKTVSFKEKKEEATATRTTVKERKNKLSVREVVKTVSFKGDAEVDTKADDFINRFKQQLKMQRLESIKRYTEMLTGGARSTN